MERWIMNRLGFVNFWVYDVEEFPLMDGKLLLRGSNGSGKSITTQSFIPYILDGDRQPVRLDPFGSKDRKMEYYLLGDPENGREESTGYLYLEFKKPVSQQYRTIGIGLHAKKGSKMTTWGFCILDGRRIGQDIMLYREVGSERIPVDSRNLREQLGENNLFTDKVSDYKAMVAKHIFGIDSESISDFEQLTNILIKTRSSKLASKENLKPEQLYSILNESLQTLSEDDLRPMSEAMSKIEDSHRHIEDAQNSLRAVKAISAEYDRYNRYMLWKKAELFLKANAEAAAADDELKNILEIIREAEEQILSENEKLQELQTRLEDTEREKEALHYDDIEKMVRDKNEAETQLGEEQKKAREKEKYLSEKTESRDKKYRNFTEEKLRWKDIDSEIIKQLAGLEEYDEFVPPLHNQYIRGIRTDEKYYEYSSQCSREINDYRDCLRNAHEHIKERDRIKKYYDDSAKAFDDAKKAYEEKESSLNTAQKMFSEQKDRMIESCYIAAKNNKEYSIDDIMLKKLEEVISNYEGHGSAAEFIKLINKRQTYLSDDLSKQIIHCQNKANSAKKDLDEAERKLSELKNAAEPVPERTEMRSEARRILKEKGIIARPFYECVDFRDNVNEEQKALLEAELSDMGILDALVVSEEMYEKAVSEMGELSECIISVSCDNESYPEKAENEFFIVTADDELKTETANILHYIFGEGEFPVRIGKNGAYRNGILEGHSISEYPSRFIGAESRRKYRDRQIASLTDIRDELLVLYKAAQSELDCTNKRSELLISEFESLPKTADINQALDMMEQEKISAEAAKQQLKAAEENFCRSKQEYDDKCSEAELLCSEFPYRKTSEDYSMAIREIGSYSNELQEILTALRCRMECTLEIQHLEEDIDSLEGDIESADSDIKRINNAVHRYSETIRLCNEFLSRPENVDIAEKVSKLSEMITQLKGNIEESNKIILKNEANNKHYKEQLEKAKERLTALIEKENRLAGYFKEECELGLVITEHELTLKQCAERAVMLADKSDMEKGIVSIQERLNNVYRKHCDVLAASYNPILGDCFEDTDSDSIRKRSSITLTWQNKSISPSLFENEISAAIENDKLLVKQDEEQMFKEILLNTISKKLYYKINSSKKWVEKMSELMKNINTSMGLSFSLVWKPKNDCGDNELSFNELYSVLNKDKDLISPEDYERLSAHFRSRIEAEQRSFEERGQEVNYSDLVRNVLDYRNWFEFRLLCRSSESDKFKELTMSRFNTFSGGERALSLYIPLFAAVAAQYQKAGEQAPLILALDEAFAGVDDSNISEMFGLLEKLGFGYIVNSQALWGCYDTVPALEIAELLHEKGSDFITVILYEWNGIRKKFVE
ncbi:MAG: TIGR02680 family protein [Huintestinicola sp.]|uniref:TIGR02680 family protein n=1 Tax=Huintestinicola sp. TaxID=2981661 RepID=UPI003F0FFC76